MNKQAGFLGGSVVKILLANAGNAGDTGDSGSIPGLGGSPGVGNGNPRQYSCQRSLVGYSPWGRKESDTTKATQHVHIVFIDWKYQYG